MFPCQHSICLNSLHSTQPFLLIHSMSLLYKSAHQQVPKLTLSFLLQNESNPASEQLSASPNINLHNFPAEMLLRIFKYAAISPGGTEMSVKQVTSGSFFRNRGPEEQALENLHLTCKRFHAILSNHQEFAEEKIFFEQNIFRVTVTNDLPKLGLARYFDILSANQSSFIQVV